LVYFKSVRSGVVPYANTSIKSNGHASAHQFYNKTVTNGVYCNSHAVRNPREAKSPVKHKKKIKGTPRRARGQLRHTETSAQGQPRHFARPATPREDFKIQAPNGLFSNLTRPAPSDAVDPTATTRRCAAFGGERADPVP
jgi:hypothetical protein